MRRIFGLTFSAMALFAVAACAGNTPSPDTRSENECPTGQVLVCKGGDANSRVKDSKRGCQ